MARERYRIFPIENTGEDFEESCQEAHNLEEDYVSLKSTVMVLVNISHFTGSRNEKQIREGRRGREGERDREGKEEGEEGRQRNLKLGRNIFHHKS